MTFSPVASEHRVRCLQHPARLPTHSPPASPARNPKQPRPLTHSKPAQCTNGMLACFPQPPAWPRAYSPRRQRRRMSTTHTHTHRPPTHPTLSHPTSHPHMQICRFISAHMCGGVRWGRGWEGEGGVKHQTHVQNLQICECLLRPFGNMEMAILFNGECVLI